MPDFEVIFQPEGKQVKVPEGTLLIDAATRAGLLMDTPCGGQGRCGRCLVKVEKGEIRGKENPHLTPQQLEEGWALSCISRVASDLVVDVPPRKVREWMAVETTTASKVAVPTLCYFPFLPSVRRVFLKLPPPSLEDNAPDLDRVRRALRGQGIDDLSVDLSQFRGLAQGLREAQWQLSLTLGLRDSQARLLDIHPGQRRGPLLGIAVDIGTTNVALDLVDLRSGKIIERLSARNRQILRGEDVISRIIYTEKNPGGLSELQGLVVATINQLIEEATRKHRLAPKEIEEMVVAGNTIMTHLFLGLPPTYIRQEPYVPTSSSFPPVLASEVGVNINPRASVLCLPAVAAYVGGDITAGVLSSCLYRAEKLTLFLDIGTNGEIVLGQADWLTTCACSAGPSFEGAGVRGGMRAIPGAIEEVRINSKTLEATVRVIGDIPPQGICGSGMITTLAEMFLTGVIDKGGRIDIDLVRHRHPDQPRAREGEHGPEYVLVWAQESGTGQDIVLSEVDINNLIRTKAAIYAGMAVMARSLGIPLQEAEEVLIGGAFGQHINVEAAIQLGLLPDLPWQKFKFLGNTSLAGAYNVLVSRPARALVQEIAQKMTYFELIADNSFMNEFSAALFLPHTDLDSFPSVKAILEETAPLRAR